MENLLPDVTTINTVFTVIISVAGFSMGFLFGMDLGKEKMARSLRASEAEARECRQMALNLSAIIREKDHKIAELKETIRVYVQR